MRSKLALCNDDKDGDDNDGDENVEREDVESESDDEEPTVMSRSKHFAKQVSNLILFMLMIKCYVHTCKRNCFPRYL